MRLKTYNNFEEKEKIFTSNRLFVINTAQEFEEWRNAILPAYAGKHAARGKQLFRCIADSCGGDPSKAEEIADELIEQNPCQLVYRGINEAKFMLYNSAQRQLLTNDIYPGVMIKDFLRAEIDALKQNKPLMDYWNRLQLIVSDMLCLSYLQHYGGASPLLDFSKEVDVALFFMQDGLTVPVAGNDNPIDNYCSIYYQPMRKDLEVMKMFIDGAERAEKSLQETLAAYPSAEIDTRQVAQELGEMNVDSFYDQPYNIGLWLDNQSDIINSSALGTKISTIVTNLNIEAQHGCFVINFSSVNPYSSDSLVCCDIHKSLVPYIQEKYTNKYKRTDIYPDEEQIAKDSLGRALVL